MDGKRRLRIFIQRVLHAWVDSLQIPIRCENPEELRVHGTVFTDEHVIGAHEHRGVVVCVPDVDAHAVAAGLLLFRWAVGGLYVIVVVAVVIS